MIGFRALSRSAVRITDINVRDKTGQLLWHGYPEIPNEPTQDSQKIESRNLIGHEFYVACLSFSPNGEHLISGGDSRHVRPFHWDNPMRVWEVDTGKQIFTLGGNFYMT